MSDFVFETAITCSWCGDSALTRESVTNHSHTCQPRWWYWWPRAEPWVLAQLCFLAGLVVGVAFDWWLP